MKILSSNTGEADEFFPQVVRQFIPGEWTDRSCFWSFIISDCLLFLKVSTSMRLSMIAFVLGLACFFFTQENSLYCRPIVSVDVLSTSYTDKNKKSIDCTQIRCDSCRRLLQREPSVQ